MSSPYEPPKVISAPPDGYRSPAQKRAPLIGLILAVAAGSLLYRWLVVGELEQTAAMFVGLPTALALAATCISTEGSVTMKIMKLITLFLLITGILLIEGFICIAVASPLFYGVGLIIGLSADGVRRRRSAREEEKTRFRSYVIIGALGLMSFEGVSEFLSFSRDERVVRSWVVEKSEAEVLAALSRGPDLVGVRPPLFLQMGFPQVTEMEGGGLAVGDQWRIRFAGGEGQPGDLTARLAEAGDGTFHYECEGDSSHIAHWLNWKDATWTISPEEEGQTKIELAIRYERLLDPAWYFKPVERYGVGQAAEFFLEEMFGPEHGEEE